MKPASAGWAPLAQAASSSAWHAPAGEAPVMLERFFNRDLSWLGFNERVLAEAADKSVPALERLRFAGIVSSNLDEFFMVRVAEIARLARRFPRRRSPDGMTAVQVLSQIRETVIAQKARQAVVLKEILRDLVPLGIRIHHEFGEDRTLDREIRKSLPDVRYVIRRMADPLPPLPSDRLHLFVRFARAYAIVTIADREARLFVLPPAEKELRFVLLDRWLVSRMGEFFPGREILEAFPFKLIREADLRYRPDDDAELEDQIVEAVGRRSEAKVVRLEVDAPAYSEGALFLATALRLDSAALYRFDLPLDLRTLAIVAQMSGSPKLTYPPIRPEVPPDLKDPATLFATLRERDVLVHHPYDSFEIVVNFLKAAAEDPAVTHIYHTMYRTSADSPVLAALRTAAKRGKQVVVYVEIKARFDELNNVRSAAALRQAGARVVQPLGGLKVHSKMTQVYRTEGEASVSYLHLGTGNYHPGTARQYTDLGLLTADQDLGREVTAAFAWLARGEEPTPFTRILVAPHNMHAGIVKLIREERQHHLAGRRGRIIGKMNSLVDPDIIEALYEASTAGVTIDLWVRGICCLKPGIAGMSENIRVVSVIDRFLEHSRIYYFRAGGDRRVYLSSADWMPRNFYSRFEIAFPVGDRKLAAYIRDVVLANGLADNVKAWDLKPDGAYERVSREPGAKEVRSQFLFEALSIRRDLELLAKKG